jgi:hypothetical protein
MKQTVSKWPIDDLTKTFVRSIEVRLHQQMHQQESLFQRGGKKLHYVRRAVARNLFNF